MKMKVAIVILICFVAALAHGDVTLALDWLTMFLGNL